MARQVIGTDYIRATTLSLPAAGPNTVAGWINLLGGAVSSDALADGDLNSNLLLRIFLLEGAGLNVWHISKPGGFDDDCGFGAMNNNTWYHLCAVFNVGSQTFVYQNGVASASNPLGHNSGSPSGGFFMMGAFSSNGVASNQFGGALADIATWNTALTTGEIAALAAGARPWQIRPGNLTRWYPLDGLQSPEPDLSGNALNGTVNGTTVQPGPPVMQFTPRWPQGLDVALAPSASMVFSQQQIIIPLLMTVPVSVTVRNPP